MTTTAFTTETQKQEGARPRALIQIDLPVAGTIYLSDQQITIGANTYRAMVKDWGDILTGEKETGNFDITLLNHNDPTYDRFSDYDRTDNLTNATIRIYKWFANLAEADLEPLFKGVIDDFSYTLNEFKLSMNDGTHREHKILPVKKLSFYDFTNARQDDIGKLFPIVYGETGEVLNAQKINKGYGSVPALLISKELKKYLVAGHVSYSVPSSVWIALEGLPEGYAYLEGCTGGVNDAWTERANPKNLNLTGVVWNGSIFCAVGYPDGTDAYIVTSPDGITWTERANPKDFLLRYITWNGSIFCAVGYPDGTDAYIVTSPDGITWTERANPKNINLRGVVWNGSIFCAVGEDDGTDAYIVTSSDAITWTERANPKNILLFDITWNGSIFCAVGYSDGTDAYIVTSPDGITWTERANPKNYSLSGITWNGSIFCAVGYPDGTDAYIVTSPDGITWTERANPKNRTLYAIVYGNNLFVAVGISDGSVQGGPGDAYIITSPDAITWTESINPKNNILEGISYGNNLFLAVGTSIFFTDAYIITSEDPVNVGISSIILPAKMLCGYFLSAITTGSYFTNTAQNPANVCDRNTGTSATLNTTYPLLVVMCGGTGNLGKISKVKIATSAVHSNCRTRWAGPKALLYEACSAGVTSIKIDSGAGMDASGFMDIANGDRISYTSLTEDSSGSFWTVGGIPGSGADSVSSSHSAGDAVVMVGDWLTLTTAEVDITSQRDWSNFDFYKFEIIIEWQSGADYTPSYVGFRIEFEISEYPQVFAAVKGWSLTNRRNAIEQIKHIYTQYLSRAAGDIGSSFADAIALLETLNWKTDYSIHEEINSRELITEILKECKTSLWLDGQGKPQVKVFQFGEASSEYISYETDIIDPDGNDFKVTHTSVDEVYNGVYLKYGKNYANGEFTKEYYITPTSAYPVDVDRVAAALQSQSDYLTTNRLNIECSHIQDDTTAQNLLQYYFDYYHRRREIFDFSVSLKQFDIQIGDIIFPYHPLNHNEKSANVIKIIREGNIIKITAREYGGEKYVADTVRFSDSIVRRFGQGLGRDGCGVICGGNFAIL